MHIPVGQQPRMNQDILVVTEEGSEASYSNSSSSLSDEQDFVGQPFQKDTVTLSQNPRDVSNNNNIFQGTMP
jgi:hypothetical protein